MVSHLCLLSIVAFVILAKQISNDSLTHSFMPSSVILRRPDTNSSMGVLNTGGSDEGEGGDTDKDAAP
jgi:hypothetical protein